MNITIKFLESHSRNCSSGRHEDHQQAARAGEEGEETDEQGPTDASQPIPKTPAKTPAKVPVPSTTKRNAEQSLASWAVLTGNSPAENGSLSMVDELRYSPDTQRPESPAANGVSKESDPYFCTLKPHSHFPILSILMFFENLRTQKTKMKCKLLLSNLKRRPRRVYRNSVA